MIYFWLGTFLTLLNGELAIMDLVKHNYFLVPVHLFGVACSGLVVWGAFKIRKQRMEHLKELEELEKLYGNLQGKKR